MRKLALALAVVALWMFSETSAEAQVGYVTYYRPVTVYSPPVVAPAPVYYSSYYAPAPVVAAPVYAPVTRARTRYRPILGGTVTRYRSYYAPAPVVYAY